MTNQILQELQLFGTYFEKYVNQSGNANFSFKLGQGAPEDSRFDDSLALAATIPGRTALYVDVDGALVWGGIVWSRTYQSQAKTVSCTAQTFDSYLQRRLSRWATTFTNVEQRNIVKQIIDHMQAQPFSDIGIHLPNDATSGTTRSLTLNDYDYKFYYDLCSGVFSLDDGFDFLIDVAYSAGVPRKNLLMGYPNLGDPQDDPQLVLEYPGDIYNYYFPESCSNGANRWYATGAGDGEDMIFGVATDDDNTTAGYPRLDGVNAYSDVTAQGTIDSHAAADLQANPLPNSVPTIDIIPPEGFLTSFVPGTYARIVIEDARFPDGYDQVVKIVGWNLTPQSSSGQESLSLVLAGQDATS